MEHLKLNLHGLYEYTAAIANDAMADGAVAVNSKLDEVVIRFNNDWYYIENDNGKDVELNFYNHIMEAFKKHGSTTCSDITDCHIEYNVVTTDGEAHMNIMAFHTAAVVEQQPVKTVDLALYKEIKDFGIF